MVNGYQLQQMMLPTGWGDKFPLTSLPISVNKLYLSMGIYRVGCLLLSPVCVWFDANYLCPLHKKTKSTRQKGVGKRAGWEWGYYVWDSCPPVGMLQFYFYYFKYFMEIVVPSTNSTPLAGLCWSTVAYSLYLQQASILGSISNSG